MIFFIYRFEERVKVAKPSLVRTFFIVNINSKQAISRTLYNAMAKPNCPQKLELTFAGKLNPTMISIIAEVKTIALAAFF